MEELTSSTQNNTNTANSPAGAPSTAPADASVSSGPDTRENYRKERSALESLTPEERNKWDEILNSDAGPQEKISAMNAILEEKAAKAETMPQPPEPSGMASPAPAQGPEPEPVLEASAEEETRQPVAPMGDPSIVRYRQLVEERKAFYGAGSAEIGSDASKHCYDRRTRGKFRQRAALDEEHYGVRLAKELELSKQMLTELRDIEERFQGDPEMQRLVERARKEVHKNLRKAYNDYTFAAKVQVDFETAPLTKARVHADRRLSLVNKVLKAAISDPENADIGDLLGNRGQKAAA